MKPYVKKRVQFAGVLVLGLICGIIAYPKAVAFIPPLYQLVQNLQVHRGLDLQGGIHLEYQADVSQVPADKVNDALQAAEAVIERRVNAFGVGEPLVQLSRAGNDRRIIVELPGVRDIEQAKQMIKETPFLEFREQAGPEVQKQVEAENVKNMQSAQTLLSQIQGGADFAALAKAKSEDPGSADQGGDVGFGKRGTSLFPEIDEVVFKKDLAPGAVYPELVESQYGWHIVKKIEERGEGDTREIHLAHILLRKYYLTDLPPEMQFQPTGLTGKNLKKVYVDYQSQGVGAPQVALEFDAEGSDLLAEISKRNVGKPLAIFIDHEIFSAPTIQQELTGGRAVVTSSFTLQTVNTYVKRLNEGALPVPIALVGQQSVDASLGEVALKQSLVAGLVGLVAVAVFMIFFYRALGLVAVFALLLYTAMLLTVFKLSVFTPFAITVTLSGIAGFVLSIGIAVDANVLIFERTREELSYGKGVVKSLQEGYRRAWPSIRDGHVSTLITTFLLIGMGTGFVKGFAIILALGVLLSLFTAVVLVRVITTYLTGDWMERHPKLLVSPKKKLE